VLKLLTD